MPEAKHTQRAIVRVGFDGRVDKTFLGEDAETRFRNEVRALRYLEERGCPFVPRVIEADEENLHLVTTNCGERVDRVSRQKKESLFKELESYGVRHDDPEVRNLTYRRSDGRFCIIDFEFATILEDFEGEPPVVDLNAPRGAKKTERKPQPEHDQNNPYLRRRAPGKRVR